jgi:hypothetical protein
MSFTRITLLTLALFALTVGAAEAYTFIGGKWHDPALPVVWRLNTFHNEPSIPGNGEFVDLRESPQVWEDIANNDFTHMEGPEITTQFPCGLQTDGQNVISMRDCLNQCTGGCLGVTATSIDIGVDYSMGDGFMRNIENDITFTKQVSWITQADAEQGCSGRFVLLGVAVHEVGHLIGLGHTSVGGATMFPSTGPCNLGMASPATDDILGANNLYDESDQEYQIGVHDVNNVRLTVNNFGNIGVTGGGGIGSFEFPVGTSHIYEGSLIFAAEGDTMVSDDYRIAGGQFSLSQDADFLPQSDLTVLTPGIQTDQETISIFDDSAANRTGAVIAPSGTTTPLGITVTQKTYACADAPDDDYIILEYRLKNESGGTINDLNVGLIIDWDFNGLYQTQTADYDAVNRLGWVSEPTTTNRGGVRVLNSEGVRSYRALVSSGAGFDIYTNTTKADWLSQGFVVTNVSNADIGMLIATGPFDVADGETVVAAFALLAGTSLADLQANSQAAQTKYDSLSGSSSVGETAGVVGPSFKLHRNRPNPATSSTRIGFAMDRAGKSTLRVFDARGRLVRTLADGTRNAGVHEVTWDGRDDLGKEMASGVYFYELSVDGELVQSRKMHMLR